MSTPIKTGPFWGQDYDKKYSFDKVVDLAIKIEKENKQLRGLLDLERELSDALINYLDQNLVYLIGIDLDYSERRAALEAYDRTEVQ